MEKTLHNSDVSPVRVNVADVQIYGDGDLWQLLSKASSQREGWMKSCKAMEIPGVGCIVQVTTQQRNPDGSYAVADALSNLIPGTTIVPTYGDDGIVVGRAIVALGPVEEPSAAGAP